MQRDAILRKKLPDLGIDGILITDLNNLRYVTGFTGSSGFLIITRKDSIFVTDFRYQEQAKQEVKGFEIIIETGERARAIKKIADKCRIKKLGFEGHSINYSAYKKLLKQRLKLKALTDTVGNLRAIKTNKELSCIKTAIRRSESAFRRLLPFIKVGATEQELAIRLEGFLREEGCKKIPFGVIVASGLMSALPHAQPTQRKLKKGDVILVDWGGECEGYYCDIARMVAIKVGNELGTTRSYRTDLCGGRDIKKQMEIYSIVIKAQGLAIKSIKPGINARIIDKSARTLIKEAGYGDYFGHGIGHGIGLSIHEKPVISWQSTDRIEKGMVFTIEPGIYLPGVGGVRIEDIVTVGENGAEILTTLPRRLYVM